MNRFRPVAVSKKYSMKLRIRTGESVSYNWQTREQWTPVGWQVNHRTIARTFSKLHYLACHSPVSIQRQWRPAYNRFYQRHFGTVKMSVRYANQWSCHSWL
jgi:hypothetical protein